MDVSKEPGTAEVRRGRFGGGRESKGEHESGGSICEPPGDSNRSGGTSETAISMHLEGF